jgi:putative oxidoreductase
LRYSPLKRDSEEENMRKPKQVVTGVLAVVARVLLCAVFLAAVLGYTALDVNSLTHTIALKTALAPMWVLIVAIALLVAGSLSVVVGYKARFGALALLALLVLATYLFGGFTFWNVVNAQARHDHIVRLAMDLSMMGAMLFIVVNGAGQMSLDGKRR